MGDDWRVELDVEGHGGLQHLLDGFREHRLAREARDRLGEGTHVTVDADRLFAYAETEAQAREAERVLSELAAARNLRASATVTRWHPEAERWEPADATLPRTRAEHAAERATRDADEEAESRLRGFAEWEVRVELAGAEDAEALAARLEGEGMTVVRRSRYVVVPVATEDDASALASRIRAEAPDARSVTAEGSAAVAMDELSPFAALSHLLRRG
jgi:hypothetical protein